MRTVEEIAEIQRQAKLNFSYRGNQYAYALTQGIQSENFVQFYKPWLAIKALSSQTLSLLQLNQIADYLVQNGYYFNTNASLYNEVGYDVEGFTSV